MAAMIDLFQAADYCALSAHAPVNMQWVRVGCYTLHLQFAYGKRLYALRSTSFRPTRDWLQLALKRVPDIDKKGSAWFLVGIELVQRPPVKCSNFPYGYVLAIAASASASS
eukprot:6185757-Pleurochrysis_carterae.AAC.1